MCAINLHIYRNCDILAAMLANNRLSMGETIRAARLQANLTQQELTDAINEKLTGHELIERSLISRWEQDKHFPSNSRRSALESVLGITLGSSPMRQKNTATFIAGREEFFKAVDYIQKESTEIWIMRKAKSYRSKYEHPNYVSTFDTLRQNNDCLFRELLFVNDQKGIDFIKGRISRNFPNYNIKAQDGPAPDMAVLISPTNKLALLHPVRNEDSLYYGLLLSGNSVQFAEQYFRDYWEDATPILGTAGLHKDNLEDLLRRFKNLNKSPGDQLREALNEPWGGVPPAVVETLLSAGKNTEITGIAREIDSDGPTKRRQLGVILVERGHAATAATFDELITNNVERRTVGFACIKYLVKNPTHAETLDLLEKIYKSVRDPQRLELEDFATEKGVECKWPKVDPKP